MCRELVFSVIGILLHFPQQTQSDCKVPLDVIIVRPLHAPYLLRTILIDLRQGTFYVMFPVFKHILHGIGGKDYPIDILDYRVFGACL